MFLGEYRHGIDAKGRLFLPARYRPFFASGAVLTRGLEPCLYLFTWSGRRVAERISALPLTVPEAREWRRFFFGGAFDVVPDEQGRILIPASLRAYAGLEAQAVIVGVHTHLEIWSPSAWEEILERFQNGRIPPEHWAGLQI
ncbi:MAG: division/cell wall cluster transcriptional repressor MraZ [Thermoflexus sp.]